ncbi:MAG: 2Fe-2S iron-sulfur cluster-binding protein [bacterium]|nr:2Fe-2S iron-sulfur cluster-binding protein [bacterium]
MVEPSIYLTLRVDNMTHDLETGPFEPLVDVLRERLGKQGVKIGCREGVCGSCNVLIDGELARSCLVLAAQVEGRDITTVDGLGSRTDLHPLQEEFISNGAIQCGFCTPGFLVAAAALLADQRGPVSRQDVADGLSGRVDKQDASHEQVFGERRLGYEAAACSGSKVASTGPNSRHPRLTLWHLRRVPTHPNRITARG